jgi:RimJ/RimL family protein N-acetyltransferase
MWTLARTCGHTESARQGAHRVARITRSVAAGRAPLTVIRVAAVRVDGRARGPGTACPSRDRRSWSRCAVRALDGSDAIRMAAFTSPDQDDRAAFERRWARLTSDVSTTNRVVEIGGRVMGHIASFDLEGHREVTYWIGREDWGRGIATRALQQFLRLEASRPLYAGAASDNAASIRVLTKCGFSRRGRGARVRSRAQRGNGRGRAPTRCMTPTALGWASVPE